MLLGPRLTGAVHHRPSFVRAQPDNQQGPAGPDGTFESLFSKELKRRGMDSGSSMDEPAPKATAEPPKASASSSSSSADAPPKYPSGNTASTNPFASGSSTKTTSRPRALPPPMAQSADDQRQKSISLVNEGLEGLIPRASVLIQLGGGFFLVFLPFLIVISILFSGIYFTFGDSFVHGGRPGSGPPPYIDPQELLSAPTVDPYVTFRDYPRTYDMYDQ